MLRVKLVVSVLTTVAALAALAPSVHAGAGSGQPLPAGTLGCRLIQNGVNPTQRLNLSDTTLSVQNVPAGPAALLCEGVDVGFTGSVNKGPLLTTVAVPNAMTCYSVGNSANSLGNNGPATASITDAFGSGTFQVSGFKLICVPAEVE